MNNSKSDIYAKAGVDITAGYKSVELIKKHIAKTNIKGVISSIGGFGGLFELDLKGIKKPVLVSGTDGVGTKLKIAFLMNKHDTIGIDCVAMCVNDIICVGAKPLIFLDYIACGKNYPEKISEIVKGISKGCVQSNCALIGGETAEMPDFYSKDEYDLAGYSTGIVDKSKMPEKCERLIPCQTVSGQGMLKAFKPDKIIISNGKNKIEITKVYVALSDVNSKKFSAVLSNELINI